MHASPVLLGTADVIRKVRAPAGDGEPVQYSGVRGCGSEGCHHGVAVLSDDACRRLRYAIRISTVISLEISRKDGDVFPVVPLPDVGLPSREPAVERHPRLQNKGCLPVRGSIRTGRERWTVRSLCDPEFDFAPRLGIVEGCLELRLAACIAPG